MLTHIDKNGKAKMVDVSNKSVTFRKAYAGSSVKVGEKIFDLIKNNEIAKGDVLNTSKIAGVMAAKNTGNLIPLCHPLNVSYINIVFQMDDINHKILIFSEAVIDAKTGVEMEALTAATFAALTIYDMCKGVDKGMVIGETFLIKKTGGKSGIYRNKEKINGYVYNIKDNMLEIIGILPVFLEANDKLNINGNVCNCYVKNNNIILDNIKQIKIAKGDKVWIE
jgi:cyclic pyranopterin phosphate synthase